MSLSVDIDPKGISALVDMFGATEQQLQAAMRSTYGKMGRWMRTHSIRGLSQKLRIQQKILRGRVRTFRMQHGVNSDGAGAKVWYGIKPIPLDRLKPREVGGGVRTAGGRFVEGAFIAKRRGRDVVFKREGQKRLPILVQYADISDESITYIEDMLVGTALFDAQFYKFLEHEIRWRTQILK